MKIKSDESLATLRDVGRSDLFIRDLVAHQNLIQDWVDNLEKQASQNPHDISHLRFGKILEYLLLQNFQQIGLANLRFDPKLSNDDYWEWPSYNEKRTETGFQLIKHAYRIYFTGFNEDSEDFSANRAKAKIHYFTTMTNEGLMAFSFEDKIEPINLNLFKELAIHLEVTSYAWAQLINFQENSKTHSNEHLISQILGLIFYLNINPDCGDDVFYKILSLLEKSTDNAFNSTVVALLKDIIPEYDNKVITYIRNNNPIDYEESNIQAQERLFQPSQNQMDSLISEMREAKALQEQNEKAQQERELKRILIEAIDDYLDWRKNNKTTKGYQHKSGWFSWLRHYTSFGENRAIGLKRALENVSDLDSMSTILRTHFESNSKLNNHSLDSYLLRALYQKNDNFKSLFDFAHITIYKDTKTTRTYVKDSLLEQIEQRKNLGNPVENSVDEKSGESKPVRPNKTKIGLNVTKIPTSEREQNILAVLTVLNNDELLKNQDGSIPQIIQEIREIVGTLDPSNEEDIVEAIINIKDKITDSGENIDNERARIVINAFNLPNNNFKKIRVALEVDQEMKYTMDSISGTSSQNEMNI